jgi:hypothetical protein
MRLISFVSVPLVALTLCGCPGANSTDPNAAGGCGVGQQCGSGGTGDPSGSAVGSGTGTGVGGSGGSGEASSSSTAGGAAGSGAAGGAGGMGGGTPADPCVELLAALNDALSQAQECIPGFDMPQCQVFVGGICCEVVVNGDQIAIQTYLAALDAAKLANCPCPLPPPLDCQANPTASCVADGENTGHCVIDPP